ncbi:MAG: PAS domain S-box protein, partial [Planctomycetota bacterium]
MEEKVRCERNSSLLIVEDDESQLRTLTAIMQEEGFDVIGCSTASEALEHLNRLETGVVVLDLRLPDLSGTQLLERLADATDKISVIINTAYSSYESAKDALNLGAFAYVEKAGDPDELLRHVHRAFQASLRSYADELETAVAERTHELLQANESLKEEINERELTEEALRASEEKYRALFENAGEGIITLDMDGRITGANRLVEEYGFNRDELVERRLFDFVPEYDKARSVIDFQALVVGSRVQGQMDVITPKGIRTVEYRDTPIVRAEEVIGVQIILTDITERKKVEEALRDSEEKFSKAFHASADIVAIARLEDGKLIEVNEAYTHVTGYTREEVIGHDTLELGIWIKPKERSRVYQLLKEHGQIRNEEASIRMKSG